MVIDLHAKKLAQYLQAFKTKSGKLKLWTDRWTDERTDKGTMYKPKVKQ